MRILLIPFFTFISFNPLTCSSFADSRLLEAFPLSQIRSSAAGWKYSQSQSTAGDITYRATLISTNMIEFSYPYAGGTNVSLTIRKTKGDRYVYLEVEKGLFTRSFQNGSAQVQFDGQKPIIYSLSAAANGRANIVFFEKEAKLIEQMKRAKNMVVNLSFAGQKPREIKFQIAGLRWNH
ncbi:hypothetical protein F5984_00005 [Rudanella paleaurantiibacter]|uniref:Uncharacterized protein n=1 Tax=Rudanella paleaurantiibacter TaxID=2614655 RepID=A0A7J5U5H3_9BACT|nr:hypothetical protein [Rudanella paleaurantiibacter]KAB7732390.1 hypothetical protein F5984_00005 [Rudanella paleaurantiibacter]